MAYLEVEDEGLDEFGVFGGLGASADRPTWLIVGDEFVQEMFRYFGATRLAERAIGDVIGSSGSTFKSWTYAGEPDQIASGSRSGMQIYSDEDRAPVTIIVLGTNPPGTMPSDFASDAARAVAAASKYGQVVVVGPFGNDPSGSRLAALRRIVPDAVSGYDLAAGLPRAADGLHFTAAGYKALLGRIVDAVFQVLDRRAPKPAPAPTTSAAPAVPSSYTSVALPAPPANAGCDPGKYRNAAGACVDVPPEVSVTPLSSTAPKAWYRRPTTWLAAGGALLLVAIVAASGSARGPAREV